MLQTGKGKKIIAKIPNNKILLESDGPFIKINNKIFRPTDLKITISELAILKQKENDKMQQILFKNFVEVIS